MPWSILRRAVGRQSPRARARPGAESRRRAPTVPRRRFRLEMDREAARRRSRRRGQRGRKAHRQACAAGRLGTSATRHRRMCSPMRRGCRSRRRAPTRAHAPTSAAGNTFARGLRWLGPPRCGSASGTRSSCRAASRLSRNRLRRPVAAGTRIGEIGGRRCGGLPDACRRALQTAASA